MAATPIVMAIGSVSGAGESCGSPTPMNTANAAGSSEPDDVDHIGIVGGPTETATVIAMAFTLDAVDESFFTDAPQRYVYAMDVPVPPERVWAEAMTGEHPLAFVRGLTVKWTSPE